MSGIRSSTLTALCVDDVTQARNENIDTSRHTAHSQHRPVTVEEPAPEEISPVVKHNPAFQIPEPGAKS